MLYACVTAAAVVLVHYVEFKSIDFGHAGLRGGIIGVLIASALLALWDWQRERPKT